MLEMLYFCGIAILQIVLESFPISSSGHLILIERVWSMLIAAIEPQLAVGSHYFSSKHILYEHFVHLMHVPTLAVIFVLFYNDICRLLLSMFNNRKIFFQVLFLLFITDGITSCWYFLFKLLGVSWFPLSAGFCCTALELFSLRWCNHANKMREPLFNAIILGLAQGIALLPGVSRFATTFVAAKWLGFASLRALEISMLIQAPLIAAACLRSALILYIYKVPCEFLTNYTIVCAIIATFFAYYGLWWVKRLVIQNRVWIFSLYLIIPMLVALFI